MSGRGGPTIGKDLPPGYMTFSGLEKATGVPAPTLRRWHRRGRLAAADSRQYGNLTVHLFNLDSIVQVKKIRGEVPGDSGT